MMNRARILLRTIARYFDISKSADTLITLKKVARHYDAGYLATIAHFLKLHLIGRFTQAEIFRLGIADPAMPAEVLAEVLSTVRGIHLQRAINPSAYEYVIEDKAVLYNFCLGANIRVPRLYAVFDLPCGWTATGLLLDNKDDWIRYFREEAPDHFVIKPARGLQGKMVYILTRNQDAFVDYSGQRYSGADLFHLMETNPEFDRFIIQERVENHPDITELTDTAALNTIRMVTGIDNSGEVLIFFAALKLVGGLNQVDNFHYGTTGNGVAEVSLDRGTIVKAVFGSDDGYQMKALAAHPKTGRPIVDFQVPYWQEAQEMVIDAARKFQPIKTIGWDVAITPDGPVIIEGNLAWDIVLFSALRCASPFSAYAREMMGKAGKSRLAE
jgi:hypothetical protein